MKKINFIIVTLLVLAFNIANAQVTTKIISVNVNNSTSYSNCDLIDLGTTNNNSFTFNYELKKLAGQAIGLSTLRIMFKYDNSTTASERISTSIFTNSWSNNTTSTGTITCNILQSEILVTGSSIYLEFTSDSGVPSLSCEYALKKTQQPVFNLSPTSTTVDCSSTAAKTFSVTNVYNSPGTKTYQWSYPGWSGTVNSTMSSVTLTPTSSTNLPGNVTVTPYLNGVAQPT
tara:strand:- start:1015 stop:1704 length:690 start_codon:yes stop_codon:yes gene_type:complete